MILLIDFDMTVHDKANPVPGMRMGLPLQGAKEALDSYKRDGHEIVVFTTRGTEEGKKHVEDWFRYYQIPFDEVTNIKGDHDRIIDDKARQFVGWDKAQEYVS